MHLRYNERLRERLQIFAVSMSSISQIYFHILNTERRRVQLLPLWKRIFHWNKSKSTMFMEALARMSDLDIAKITEEALGCRLPQFEQSSSKAKNHLPQSDNPQFPPDSPAISQLRTSRDTSVSSSKEAAQRELQLTSTDVDSAAMQQLSSANWAALRGAILSKSKISEHCLPLPTVQPSQALPTVNALQESVFELQEVVIDGADSGAGTPHNKGRQRRSIAHHGAADGTAASVLRISSSSVSNAAMPMKTVSALAPEQRGKSGVRALTAAVRRPIEAASASLQTQNSSIHAEQLQTFAANVDTGGTAAQTSIQPPPRSRSGSRIRGSDAAGVASAADRPLRHRILIAGAAAMQQASAARLSGNSSATSVLATAVSCSIPQPPPRSRSQSRIRASETARVEEKPALHEHPGEAAHDAPDDSNARRLSSTSAAIAATAAVVRSSRSKKHASKKAQDSGQPPPISVAQRLRIMGVEYEEC